MLVEMLLCELDGRVSGSMRAGGGAVLGMQFGAPLGEIDGRARGYVVWGASGGARWTAGCSGAFIGVLVEVTAEC